jgi:hypothetical protein
MRNTTTVSSYLASMGNGMCQLYESAGYMRKTQRTQFAHDVQPLPFFFKISILFQSKNTFSL